jgi:hypothetical protein
VPPELRGLAVRIEDDVVVIEGEPLVLSAALPTYPDELTAWMADVQASSPRWPDHTHHGPRPWPFRQQQYGATAAALFNGE